MVTASQILEQIVRVDAANARITNANNRIATALNQITPGTPGQITDEQANQILASLSIVATNSEQQAAKTEANATKAESLITPAP